MILLLPVPMLSHKEQRLCFEVWKTCFRVLLTVALKQGYNIINALFFLPVFIRKDRLTFKTKLLFPHSVRKLFTGLATAALTD